MDATVKKLKKVLEENFTDEEILNLLRESFEAETADTEDDDDDEDEGGYDWAFDDEEDDYSRADAVADLADAVYNYAIMADIIEPPTDENGNIDYDADDPAEDIIFKEILRFDKAWESARNRMPKRARSLRIQLNLRNINPKVKEDGVLEMKLDL